LAIGGKKKKSVSYVLTGIVGQAHMPTFTYMCQIYNTKVVNIDLNKYLLLFYWVSFRRREIKKAAKQNTAAQMCEKLFELKLTLWTTVIKF